MLEIRTLTFAIVHSAVAFTVVYLVTGDPILGGAVAFIEPACNTVAYFFHERVWERIRSKLRGAEVRGGQLAPT